MQSEIEALDAEIAVLFAEAFSLTARALAKLAIFDREQCWAALSFQSCAHWLNFRIGISLGAAREHVRVARALEGLPETSTKFSAGTLSYSKVRALTRIARAENEAELVEMANHMTASQVEKVVRSVRRVSSEEAKQQLQSRSVQMGFDADGMFFMRVRLLPEEGSRLMQTLDRLMPDDAHRTFDERRADALMALGSEKSETELIVHVDSESQCQLETSRGERVSVAEETARRLSCDASLVEMQQDAEGHVLDVGRKTRKISAGMRRALSERDQGCRFPGCANRIIDRHHVRHWQDGGETSMSNVLEICRHHHGLVHEGGYRVELTADGTAAFFDPRGARVRPPEPLAMFRESVPLTATPWRGVDWTWRDMDLGLTVSAIADR
jgi:hypothetical protein